jgi:hypothetical protein
MPNRQLTAEELVHANALLGGVRAKLQTLSHGDKNLFEFPKVFRTPA